MFTGIVEGKGVLRTREPRGGDFRFVVDGGDIDLSDAQLGDSIAVNGVCLTITTVSDNLFSVDVSNETLACTTLGKLQDGQAVNLERAVTPTTRLGGHLVSGHVDGVGRVEAVGEDGRSWRIRFGVPRELTRYIAGKGSICVDGVSLTVNEVGEASFSVNVIPHTMERTIIGRYCVGTGVNIEVDVMARYLERLLTAGVQAGKSAGRLDETFLAEHGFLARGTDVD